MPNIFEGLEQLEDQVIREYIAMLEVVNMGNVFKGYGTTVANKSVKLINGIGDIFGKNFCLTPRKEMRLEDYIEENKHAMVSLDRKQLDERLIQILSEKSQSTSKTKDMISAEVIQVVANDMKLEENMTIAQKADSIHRRYLEKMLSAMQEQLKKQDLYEANATIVEIEKNINQLSDADKEELKKVLNINELTGKEIRNVLMKTGTPALIIGALSASGFGAFMALTTVMHAIFTTILGITLPFAVYTSATSTLSLLLGPAGIALVAGTAIWQITRGNKKLRNEIMGQVIFGAVNACGGSFVVKDKELPSYEDNAEILELIAKRDEEYNKLVEENTLLQDKVSCLEQKYKRSQENINTYKQRIVNEVARRNRSEHEISKLKDEQAVISAHFEKAAKELTRLEAEVSAKKETDEATKLELEKAKLLNASYVRDLKKLADDICYQNMIIKEASNEIEAKTKLIEDTELKKLELEQENLRYKEEITLKDQKIEKTQKIRRKEITEKWHLHYPKFEITSAAIRDAVGFSKKEVWEIERTLMELHSLKDFKSASIGKIRENGVDYEHMPFTLPSGLPARVLYRITNDSNKKVVIEMIYKHSSKFYQ
nr:hypothetical protein [uncultured Niameybacter sp.]